MSSAAQCHHILASVHLLLVILILSTGANLIVPAQGETDEATTSEQTCSAGTDGEEGSCVDPSLQFPLDEDGLPIYDNPDDPYNEQKCGLWLAESTIPNAGLGIFTTVEKPVGDFFLGDICIPLIDIKFHNPQPFFNPFNEYYWMGEVMGMSREVDSHDIQAYCPGIDCAVNCNLALINLKKSSPSYDLAFLHRSKDPGAGAFSPYHNGTTQVKRAIPVGGELFKNYGDDWFETRPSTFGPTFPLTDDFPKAVGLLKQFQQLDAEEDVLRDAYRLTKDMTDKYNSSTLGALPTDLEDAQKAAEASDIGILYQPNATRSVEWLNENARCLDNIENDYSKIPQAARGAYASRKLYKGQRITTSPLHHLPYEAFCNMNTYRYFKDEQGINRRVIDKTVGKQVLLNYCYGHRESTLLLCPYGSGINYLNHNKTLANVRIRWAKDFDIVHNQPGLETGHVEELMWVYKPQFAFDYIALRDIEKDEELYLDYGDDWEEAWNKHVETYQPGEGTKEYMPSVMINHQYGNTPLKTRAEQEKDPYPAHLQLRCHSKLLEQPVAKGYRWLTKEYGNPCRILDRYQGQYGHWYTVEIGAIERQKNVDRFAPFRGDIVTKWKVIGEVPRSGIAFFDVPGSTDLFLPNAFRHKIGIPDDMFPEQMKNLKPGYVPLNMRNATNTTNATVTAES